MKRIVKKLHYRCAQRMDEMTNIVTLVTLMGDLVAICFHEFIVMRTLSVLLLLTGMVIASKVFYTYHHRQVRKERKKMLTHKLRQVKFKQKRGVI